jgi:hypothetical protein
MKVAISFPRRSYIHGFCSKGVRSDVHQAEEQNQTLNDSWLPAHDPLVRERIKIVQRITLILVNGLLEVILTPG